MTYIYQAYHKLKVLGFVLRREASGWLLYRPTAEFKKSNPPTSHVRVKSVQSNDKVLETCFGEDTLLVLVSDTSCRLAVRCEWISMNPHDPVFFNETTISESLD